VASVVKAEALGRDRARRPAQSVRTVVSMDEAADALGVSPSHFKRHVLPRVRVTMSGRRRLIAVRGLERYLDERAV
jgi:hypothetical protein